MPAANAIEEKYPNVYAVAEALGLQIMAEPEYSNDEDQPEPIGNLYHIGDRGDRSVGIDPTGATPYFKSMEEMEAFCKEHCAKFEEMAELESWPQKPFWEK